MALLSSSRPSCWQQQPVRDQITSKAHEAEGTARGIVEGEEEKKAGDNSSGGSHASAGVCMLVELRLARKRLLRELGSAMCAVAADPSTAHAKLDVLQRPLDRLPDIYPMLAQNPSLIDGNSMRRWDWEMRAFDSKYDDDASEYSLE